MLYKNQKSLRGKTWIERENKTDINPVPLVMKDNFLATSKLHEVLLKRGHDNHERFLTGGIKDYITRPDALSNMDRLTDIMENAIKENKKICLLGDYDVDGATSTASFIIYFRAIGYTNFDYYIPDRITEGYGPNNNAISRFKDNGGDILMILDSGTLSFSQVEHAKSIGMEVLILDHHDPDESGKLPDAVLVNPKKPEDAIHELQHLCTAGLAMLTLLTLNKKLRDWYKDRNLPENPDMVIMQKIGGLTALGTVADVMKLKTLNRGYLKQLLPAMRYNKGLSALKKVFDQKVEERIAKTGKSYKKTKFDTYNCGFTFGPAINACGRIDDCMRGVNLLIEEDEEKAMLLAKEAVEINDKRKEMQKEMEEFCQKQAEERGNDPIIIAYNPEWHPGIVGLSASKIKEKEDKPVVVIGQNGKGSARSIDGYDVGQAFRMATEKGLIKAGGGHSAAAGLTIYPEKLEEFRQFMIETARNIERKPVEADLVLNLDNVSMKDIHSLKYMEPFGMGNPSPHCIMTGGTIHNIKENSAGGISFFYKENNKRIKCLVWNEAGTPFGIALSQSEGLKADILGKLDIESWNGSEYIKFSLEDIIIEKPQ